MSTGDYWKGAWRNNAANKQFEARNWAVNYGRRKVAKTLPTKRWIARWIASNYDINQVEWIIIINLYPDDDKLLLITH